MEKSRFTCLCACITDEDWKQIHDAIRKVMDEYRDGIRAPGLGIWLIDNSKAYAALTHWIEQFKRNGVPFVAIPLNTQCVLGARPDAIDSIRKFGMEFWPVVYGKNAIGPMHEQL